MAHELICIEDPRTGEASLIYLDELEDEAFSQIAKPVGGFCWKAEEFVRLQLKPMPFYIKNWLPKRGKAMLYAPAKAGKSYLCLQMARCIGSGEDFLSIPTTQGTVLYCQLELGAEVLQARLQSTKKTYGNVFVGTTFSMKLDIQGGQRLLDEAMRAIEPNVLIIDPLYKVLAGDENESKDMRTLIDYLDSLIEGFGCSIVIIHHPGKDIKKGGRGSSVLEDWVDSGIEMKKTSKKDEALKVKLTPKFLRHSELPPEPIEAIMKNFEFEPIGETTPTVRQEVAKTVKGSSHAVSPKELFSMGIGTNASVYSALNKLIAQGKVNRVGRGLYKWNKG